MKDIAEVIAGLILLALILVPMAVAAFIVGLPMGIAFVAVIIVSIASDQSS